ncbi:hypothetical protein MUP32_04740 [Candidatus Microgenomates bacterium]|nr:hypothetical protein [Candidatus Microgenomates bacterium]
MRYQLGTVFSEQITKSRRFRKMREVEGNAKYSPDIRVWVFVGILFIGLGLLLSRLFLLTVIQGNRFRQLAEGNRLQEQKIYAPRGIIYDRKGVPLVRNIPAFVLPDKQIFFENPPATQSAQIQEIAVRDYVFKDLFAHVLGYTAEVSQEELGKLVLGDLVGKMGIEKSYDETLRGVNGKLLFEVDALGQKIRTLGKVEAKTGKNLTLTLDSDLQKAAQETIAGKKGAIVVSNSQTGEILAYYSSPSFDPNLFIRGEEIKKLFEDPNQPLFDRVIAGTYPPGSTFKIITSVAALESGTIDKETKIEDTGILKVGEFSFGNWYFNQYGKKEGWLDIVGAIRRSNDIFFYTIGEKTGIETIAGWAKKMGLGKKTGIDIDGEAEGLMPDPAWRKKERGEDWYLGNTYHIAIGQGDILSTPLQVNTWTNVIASGGKLCQPHLTKDQRSIRQLADKDQNELCKDLEIKKENIELIREGMKEACAVGGTGYPLFDFKIINDKLQIDNLNYFEAKESTVSAKPYVGIPVACKTGTAEYGDLKNSKTHAWFTVFAPVYNPQITITVLVEGGGEGSTVAAPMAKKILEEWFKK